MHLARIAVLLLILVCGCRDTATSPQPAGSARSAPSAETAQKHVDSWSDMGGSLPDKEQVAFFRSNLPETRDQLVAALGHTNPDVRQRAAYVIGEIGEDARSFGPDLLARLRIERERLVRLYIFEALLAVGHDDADAIAELKGRFESLNDTNVLPAGGQTYDEVDEKIKVAAALYVLDDGPDRAEYLAFVLKWLQPPPDGLAADELEGYWERRWMAVTSLESMTSATDAIPLLEAMLEEENAKPWVSVHVPRVLGVLRSKRAP